MSNTAASDLPVMTSSYRSKSNTPQKSTPHRSRKIQPVIAGLAKGPDDSATANGRHELRVSVCAHKRSNFYTLRSTWGGLVSLFSKHVLRESKDGAALIFGELQEYRTDADVLSIFALTYEIDGKLSLSEVQARVKESGFEAFIWTTHSHLRTRQSVCLASYKKWHRRIYGVDGDPTDERAQLYCSTHKSYTHLINVRLADAGRPHNVRRFGKSIAEFDIAHDPEHKTRIVFPLATPIFLGDGGLQIADYKAIYHAHGKRIFGEAYSSESQNPARLHYLPSHPPGMTGESIHFNGELVDPEPIWKGIEKTTLSIQILEPLPDHRSVAIPSAGLDELEYILRQIPPDLEYPDWFKCIAAIFYETKGSDAGAELAHSWSSGDSRYRFIEVERIWDSLDLAHRQPARIGSLVQVARNYNDSFRPYSSARKILDFILHKRDQ